MFSFAAAQGEFSAWSSPTPTALNPPLVGLVKPFVVALVADFPQFSEEHIFKILCDNQLDLVKTKFILQSSFVQSIPPSAASVLMPSVLSAAMGIPGPGVVPSLGLVMPCVIPSLVVPSPILPSFVVPAVIPDENGQSNKGEKRKRQSTEKTPQPKRAKPCPPEVADRHLKQCVQGIKSGQYKSVPDYFRKNQEVVPIRKRTLQRGRIL